MHILTKFRPQSEVAPTPKLSNSNDPQDAQSTALYQADRFVQDALRVRITPFQLDNFASEWEELRRQQTAHAMEMDILRQTNRTLQAQVYVRPPHTIIFRLI